MAKILLTNFYREKPLAVVKGLLPSGFELIHLDESGRDEIIKKAPDADYLLVGGRSKIDTSVLSAMPNLKMVQRSGVGLDSLDLKALKDRNIPLYVNKGVNARSVAEHTVMLLLSGLRQVVVADQETRAGRWVKHDLGISGHDLFGKTVGLIGFGNIACHVAQMLTPFGVRILYTKRNRLGVDEEQSLGVEYALLEDVLAQSDVISLHCPLTTETQHLIDDRALSLVKRGVYLVNTARGALVEDTALLKAIETGVVKGAALDTFSLEPLPTEHPYLQCKAITLTPHMGGVTYETFSTMINKAFSNIASYHAGDYQSIEKNLIYI